MQICFRFGLFVFESEISVTLKYYLNIPMDMTPPNICGYSNHFQIPPSPT